MLTLEIQNRGLAKVAGMQIAGVNDHFVLFYTGLSHDYAIRINDHSPPATG